MADSKNRRSGVINIQANGQVFDAVGAFSYNLGQPKREMLVGHDRVHGFKELPQVPFVEGEIRDSSDLDVASVLNLVDATITLKLANGKTIMLRDACQVSEGTGDTEEGKFSVRFEGKQAEEV